jgi:hypothetical protein
VTLKGNYDQLSAAFQKLVDDYVATKYSKRDPAQAGAAVAEHVAPSLRVIA